MDEKERKLYGVIFALSIALAVLTGYTIASFAHAQNPDQTNQIHTMVVTGVGTASANPNLAKVMLGILTHATNATDAMQENADKMNQVIEALKAMNITEESMETSRFSLSPLYEYGYKPPKLVGFSVSNQLTVTITEIDKVGQIIDEAVEAGANQVNGVYFTLTDEKIGELTEHARQKAVEDANGKATSLATSLNITIVGIHYVSETVSYHPYRYPYTYYYPYIYTVNIAWIRLDPLDPPVIPSEEQITVTIQVTYIIQ